MQFFDFSIEFLSDAWKQFKFLYLFKCMLNALKINCNFSNMRLFVSMYLHVGYVISTAAPSTTAALAIAPALMIPFLLFGGFFLNSGYVLSFFQPKNSIFMMEFYMYVKAIKYWFYCIIVIERCFFIYLKLVSWSLKINKLRIA